MGSRVQENGSWIMGVIQLYKEGIQMEGRPREYLKPCSKYCWCIKK